MFLSPPTEFNPSLLEDLKTKGWSASSELVPLGIVEQLSHQIEKHILSGNLKPAHIGHGEKKKIRTDIRGDSILWLNSENPAAFEKDFFTWLSALRNYLNENLQLGLQSEELHYAVYPPGAGYQKHKDVFEDSDQRVLSFVLYLNKGWKEENGGQIVIYKEGHLDQVDATILPTLAQCVIFLSGTIYHEVIFTMAERKSVTGWLRKTL